MMNTSIAFTLNDVMAGFGLITAAAAVWAICIKFYTWAKKPNTEQNKRLDAHEQEIADIKKTLSDHEKWFEKDLKKFEAIENENHIELQALLALLEHGIDGNNVDQMQRAKETLQNYLILK